MRAVLKYNLDLDDHQAIPMPSGAKILSFDNQQERLTLWAECDTESPMEVREVCIVPTGGPIPEGYCYVGTALFQRGRFVVHAYEKCD